MDFFLNIIKKLIFSFFFDFDDDFIENEDYSDENQDQKDENENTTTKKKTFSYTKLLIFSISLISFIFFFNYISLNNTDTDLKQLQQLLDELALVVDWNIYRDIFLNIQKIINDTTSISEKNMALFVLKEIYSFFLLNSTTSEVKDPVKFNKIMKEIITFLSKEE
nr:hypothetical protein [Phytophthora palmivora]